MKKILFLLCMMIGSVYAQDQTTGNLVYTTVNPAPTGTNIGQSWTGFSNVTSTGGNSTSDNGSFTGYNPNTGTFMFGYNQGTIAYTYAINQALANAGAGIQVRGYNYSWDINNLNYDNRQSGTDTLTARVTTFAPDNVTALHSYSWTYNTKFDWTTFSGTVDYSLPYDLVQLGNMRLEFTGRDGGFWAGYYGPMVRNISLSLNYMASPVDPCTSDPLSSPSCPGYQQAYHDQQCMSNPLYATSCPGYQQAYYNQQCFANPLYDSGCPGYQQAYFNQQCSNNPLYDSQCPGYQQAYFDQQCSNNALYSNQCPGYQQAYFNQQCSLNPLYNNQCPGYEAAYFNQQCSLNTLYNQACPGYTAAYYNLQCSISPLYDSGCPGYQQAYFNQQCSLNGLYDRACPNFNEAYAKKQLLEQQNNQSSTQPTQTVTLPSTTEPTVQVSSKGQVSTEVQLVADPTVNEVLKDSTKKEIKSSSVTNEVVAPSTTMSQSTPVSQPAQKAEQKQEQKKTDNEIAKIENKADSKDTKSNREKVKEAMTEKAKELANDMSKAATLEAQTANQGLVLGLMNYNPGFSAYANAIIPDTGGIEMARQYNKPVVDNRRALRALSGASDSLHQQMVDEQYR